MIDNLSRARGGSEANGLEVHEDFERCTRNMFNIFFCHVYSPEMKHSTIAKIGVLYQC